MKKWLIAMALSAATLLPACSFGALLGGSSSEETGSSTSSVFEEESISETEREESSVSEESEDSVEESSWLESESLSESVEESTATESESNSSESTGSVEESTSNESTGSSEDEGEEQAPAGISSTLRELIIHKDEYVDKRVSFECTVIQYESRGQVCVADYDEESGLYFGVRIFYGYNQTLDSIFVEGNRVRVVGELTYSENFGYQIVDIRYDPFDPNAVNNSIIVRQGEEIVYKETDLDTLSSTVTLNGKTYAYAELALRTAVEVKSLKVVDTYTSPNGAMSFTCQDASGKEIVVRMSVLYDGNDQIVTADSYVGKTIAVKGVVDCYNDEYQIHVYETEDIVVKASDEVYNGEKVTVTLQHTLGQRLTSVLQNYLQDFNKLYPNITVQLVKTTANQDQLNDEVVNKITQKAELPSLLLSSLEYIYEYKELGAAVSLEPYVNCAQTIVKADGASETVGLTEVQIFDFITAFYESGKLDGIVYSLPFYRATDLLYYNKTFFDEHNLSVPTTWSEMETVSAQIKAIDENAVSFGYDSEANLFINRAEQAGNPHIAKQGFVFNNAGNQSVAKELRNWYDKGYFTTNNLCGGYTSNLFIAQKSYMSISASSQASYVIPTPYEEGEFEVGVAQAPQLDVNKPKNYVYGASFCMLKQEDLQTQAAAWLLMEYLTTNAKVQGNVSMVNGYIPVIKSVQEDSYYADWLASPDGVDGTNKNAYITATVMKQALAMQDSFFTTPLGKHTVEVRDSLAQLVVGYLSKLLPSGTSTEELINKEFMETEKTLTYTYYD